MSADVFFFFFNDPAPTEISPLSLHAALPIPVHGAALPPFACRAHPSPPRPVHPELDQVRVAADVARNHADRGTRGARGGGGPRVHAIDVLRRLPARRQAALPPGDGSILGAVR